MSRKTTWRNSASDAVLSHQDQALSTTLLLLRSLGPTAFLLREDREDRDFKVFLGDPHTCTCPVFTKEQEPCKHICWVLLRRFRLPREHEYSFQHGLTEGQILELLQGLHQAIRIEPEASTASRIPSQVIPGLENGSVCRKVIQTQDLCPICQEELLQKRQPVSFCRFGCGNSVHISCMKVWADHQNLSDQQDMVKCPLCREIFSSVKLLHEQVKNAAQLFTAAEREKANRHLGVVCRTCRTSPVTGTCFKCTICSHFYLCEECVKQRCHSQHSLALRTTRREKWILVTEDPVCDPKGATSKSQHNVIAAEPLPNRVLERLLTVRVRSGSQLLNEGLQCRICLQAFSLGQDVRTLPCHHKFHVDCVDQILLKSNSCPLDGFIIYSPLTQRTTDKNISSQKGSCFPNKQLENLQDLFVPGVSLQVPPVHGALTLQVQTDSMIPLNTPQKQTGVSKERQCQSLKKQTFPLTGISSAVSQSRQTSSFSKQRAAACTTVGKVREQPQVNLFVGSSRQESAARR